MGVQKHYKKHFTKKSCRKGFKKKSTKSPKPIFSRIVFYHVFGRFSVRGVQKHDKKISKKNLTLVLFWPLTHPPTTGVIDFVFIGGPLEGPVPAVRPRDHHIPRVVFARGLPFPSPAPLFLVWYLLRNPDLELR
jgi:hypothetical protein